MIIGVKGRCVYTLTYACVPTMLSLERVVGADRHGGWSNKGIQSVLILWTAQRLTGKPAVMEGGSRGRRWTGC